MNDTVFTILLNIQKNVHNYFLKIRQIQSLSRFFKLPSWSPTLAALSIGI